MCTHSHPGTIKSKTGHTLTKSPVYDGNNPISQQDTVALIIKTLFLILNILQHIWYFLTLQYTVVTEMYNIIDFITYVYYILRISLSLSG